MITSIPFAMLDLQEFVPVTASQGKSEYQVLHAVVPRLKDFHETQFFAALLFDIAYHMMIFGSFMLFHLSLLSLVACL